MTSNRPIVVGVPESPDLSAMLTYATDEVSRTGAELRLVHAWDVWPAFPDVDQAVDDLEHAELEAAEVLRRAEDEARSLLGPHRPITTSLLRGPVVDALTEASEDADLVVVQRRARPTIARVLARSITCGVAAKAHARVAVVPERRKPTAYGVVTVGIDAPQRSAVLLRAAFEEAKKRGATLRVVHTLWHVAGMGEYLVEQATARRNLDRARSELEIAVADTGLSHPEVPVEIDVRRVEPAGALVVESARSDLLLVARHDLVVALGSHLGPVAAAVVREARCPVLVVAPTHRHRRPEAPRRSTSAGTGLHEDSREGQAAPAMGMTR